jgi:hypothetical protein
MEYKRCLPMFARIHNILSISRLFLKVLSQDGREMKKGNLQVRLERVKKFLENRGWVYNFHSYPLCQTMG